MPLTDHGLTLDAVAATTSYIAPGLGATILAGNGERLSCWVKIIQSGAVATVTIRITGRYYTASDAYVPVFSVLNSGGGAAALEHAISVSGGNTYYHLIQTENQMGAMAGVRVEAKGDAAGATVSAALVTYVPDSR